MNTALAIGVGALAIFVVWKIANPPPPAASAVAPSAPTNVTGLVTDVITNPNKYNRLIFGVGTDTFKQFNELTDVQQLGTNMCACYHGNEAACRAAREQSPGLRCKVGDCDCHVTDTAGAVIGQRDVHEIHYRDSVGGPYTATVGRKVPVGGCQAPVDANVKSNRDAGYCGGLVQ
jgi:hypothetical protein